MDGLTVIFSCSLASMMIVVLRADNYLIDCGTNSTMTENGRKWIGDSSATTVAFSPSGIAATYSTVDSNATYPKVYGTARIFPTVAHYSFKVCPGRHWLRLHFYPFSFQNYTVTSSVFSAYVGSLELLSNVNIFQEISPRKSKNVYVMMEYSISVGRSLVLTFVPRSGSFAFINAIELISMPDALFPTSVYLVGSGSKKVPFGQNSAAVESVETMYRLNVGGKSISPINDCGLSRTWEEDYHYLYSYYSYLSIMNQSALSYKSPNDSYIAPLEVYETARVVSLKTDKYHFGWKSNISWTFRVDSSFSYLVRLHFCELEYDSEGQRVFWVYINNQTAASSFDVYALAGAKNRATHVDYMTTMSAESNTMFIQIGPDPISGALLPNAILNGLEIFKLSTQNCLAGSRRQIDETENPSKRDEHSSIMWIVIGAVAGGVILIVLVVGLCVFCRKKKRHLASPAQRGLRFTFEEIMIATNNFEESRVIGAGGFGKVYKGEIKDGLLVAIKRANPQSKQGQREFETEIELLSKVRHHHLVSLIGFCEEQNEMILVYEYMANGTLRGHIFGSGLPPLSWKQRLDICIGAARGLHHLHTGAQGGIIHRDVKTTNILLDENFVAKIADFGLSKKGPALDHSHVSTAVKGSFGYVDPEYCRSRHLTIKSDVYSFGVVLFEVVCGRPVISHNLPTEQTYLVDWAMDWQRKAMLEQIVDPHLAGTYNPDCLRMFGEIAEKCLADDRKDRPSMVEVLSNLEYVLRLQESNDSTQVSNLGLNVPQIREAKKRSVVASEDSEGIVVFSELVWPQGR